MRARHHQVAGRRQERVCRDFMHRLREMPLEQPRGPLASALNAEMPAEREGTTSPPLQGHNHAPFSPL